MSNLNQLPTTGMIGKYAPDDGWKEHSWYLAEVSYNSSNPIHHSLLFTGFLNKGKPAGYSCLIAENTGEKHELCEAIYIKPVCFLYCTRELDSSSSHWKLKAIRSIDAAASEMKDKVRASNIRYGRVVMNIDGYIFEDGDAHHLQRVCVPIGRTE